MTNNRFFPAPKSDAVRRTPPKFIAVNQQINNISIINHSKITVKPRINPSARPFRDADDKLISIVESFQNISDRIKAENAKEELIDDLQEALDKVNLLGWITANLCLMQKDWG